jgi:hypothetical protein
VLHDRRRLLLLILIPAAIIAMAMVVSFVVLAEDTTPPEAKAGPDLLSDDVRPIQFDASASTDDTGIVGYSWSFDYEGEAVTLEGMRAYFPFEVHGEYEVVLEVSDAAGNTDTDSLTVTVLTPPGVPTNVTVIGRSGWVDISWGVAVHNGGSNITEYHIYKGLAPDDLFLFSGNWYMEFWHWDAIVNNGIPYYYAIRAVNSVGEGPLTEPEMAVPLGSPEAPTGLVAEYRDGKVYLEWEPTNATFGRLPTTGYQVHRGTDPEWLYDTFDVGNETHYVDDTVEEGKTYYYAIGSMTDISSGDATDVVEVRTGGKVSEGVDEGIYAFVAFTVFGLVVLVIVSRMGG